MYQCCFVMKTNWLIPFTYQIKKLKVQWICCLYLVKINHIMYTDFDRFMFSETKSKNKKYFYKNCLQCFSNKNVLAEHDKICLKINNGKLQNYKVALWNLKIIWNKYQFYLKFKLILSVFQKLLEAKKVFTQKHLKRTFLAVFLARLFVLIVNLVNQLLFIEVEKLLINLLKQFLKNMNAVKKWWKNILTKIYLQLNKKRKFSIN